MYIGEWSFISEEEQRNPHDVLATAGAVEARVQTAHEVRNRTGHR